MTKVCFLVKTNMLHDARVMKSSASIQSANYDVIIHCIKSPHFLAHKDFTEDGVPIKRHSVSPRVLFKCNKSSSKYSSNSLKASGFSKPAENSKIKFIKSICGAVLFNISVGFKVRFERPDIIHVNDTNMVVAGLIASMFSKTKFVYDMHEVGISREGYRHIRPFVFTLDKIAISFASALISTTNLRQKFVKKVYKTHKKHITLENRPVLRERKSDGPDKFDFGFKNKRPVFLYQGGVQTGRGLENIPKLANEISEANFFIVGSGKLYEEMKRASGSLDNFKVHPAVPYEQLQSITKSADFGLQLIRNTCFNHWSTDSNKLFEYALAGIPVIASNFPEIRNIINSHKIGLLINPDDFCSIADAVRECANNQDLLLKFKNNLRNAAPLLCWNTQEKKLLDLYQDIT